jgi:hypothetical protein
VVFQSKFDETIENFHKGLKFIVQNEPNNADI